MKLIASVLFSLALCGCAANQTPRQAQGGSGRPAPGSFLVYSFRYFTCSEEPIKVTYPKEIKVPSVTDGSLHGKEAWAEIIVDPTTREVRSAQFLRGDAKLYSSLGDYPNSRSLGNDSANCFHAKYQVMTFAEVMGGK